jgi:hypothetical protein
LPRERATNRKYEVKSSQKKQRYRNGINDKA